jgi:hypothetical protein
MINTVLTTWTRFTSLSAPLRDRSWQTSLRPRGRKDGKIARVTRETLNERSGREISHFEMKHRRIPQHQLGEINCSPARTVLSFRKIYDLPGALYCVTKVQRYFFLPTARRYPGGI